MTNPITARHTRDIDGNPLIEIRAVGPEGSAQMLAIPRHEITISENVAQRLYVEGAAAAERLDHAEP